MSTEKWKDEIDWIMIKLRTNLGEKLLRWLSVLPEDDNLSFINMRNEQNWDLNSPNGLGRTRQKIGFGGKKMSMPKS